MIFVPLPFVVALLLAILLVRMLRTEEWNASGRRLFLALIAAYALQSILIGFRWGYDMLVLMPYQAVLAAIVAPLSFASFADLALEMPRPLARQWPHLLPAIGVALAFAFFRDIVGLSLILIFLGYGLALCWIARNGADGLVASRLDGAFLSHRSLVVTAVALIASALSDVFISFDYDRTGGAHSGQIVALGNVIALLVVGTAAAIAGVSQPDQPNESAPPPPALPREEDGVVAANLDSLMETKQVYRDPELNLSRIARKLGLPARSVSTAVNRIHGMSVSQYVNEFRIRFASEQLVRTELPVTSVMFEAGFISKSNFNREFLRVTGLSPTEYRRREQAGSASNTSSAPAFVSP